MAIDIGTNSTLHVVADVLDVDDHVIVEHGIVGNMLGVGLDENSTLDPETMDLNRSILLSLSEKARNLGCDKIIAVGTHALRSAKNSEEYIKMADSVGICLMVISPKLEAELAWMGIFKGGGSHVNSAALDIGGGSCELSIGFGVSIEWTSSVQSGAVNLTSKFFLHDPPTQSEIMRTDEYIEESFLTWHGKLNGINNLIGIGGTITSLANIEFNITKHHPGALDGIVLSIKHVRSWKERLLVMSEADRSLIPGMPTARAGNIHMGVLIFHHVLKLLSVVHIKVSNRGVLFGLVHKLSKQESW